MYSGPTGHPTGCAYLCRLANSLATMDRPQLLTKVFLAAALACTISVIFLFNIAGAGFLARLLVYAFLAGLLTSGIAAALSVRSDSPTFLQRICTGTFGAYVLTSILTILWMVVSEPPFG